MSKFYFEKTHIKNLQLITLPNFEDERGNFIKSFNVSDYYDHNAEFECRESYFSVSKKGTIRGMHFQYPPYHHEKIVFCPQGKILDVVLDLRVNSATYGSFFEVELSPENHNALYIPKGCAHGFQALEDNSITYYLVSSEYEPNADAGILYNSFGKRWDIENPIMSTRDLSFVELEDFESPFK